MPSFQILKKDKKTRARLGIFKTSHGDINTPSYVFVGTYGKFLHLSPRDIKKTKTQVVIANTFHLWKSVIKHRNTKKTFLTKSFGLNIPTMTDSGGFQVLSLAFDDKNKIGKFITDNARADKNYKRSKIKITEKGVYFKYDEKWKFMGPELSIKLQKKIGADIIFAFDHITSPLDNYKYNKKAVALTDRWAKICLKTHNLNKKDQVLFGIVQGGLFKDLRTKSAKSIGKIPFDGFGIGGSYTKKQIAKILKWVIPYLPEEKPRHLLGVGKVADIFEAIENGIDTFDCVIPTREARHGRLYTKTGHMDIRKGRYSEDEKTLEKNCGCLTCFDKIPRSKIREFIKSENKISNATGQRWCLIHNMWFFNNLLEKIRKSIKNDRFEEFKKSYLQKFETNT